MWINELELFAKEFKQQEIEENIENEKMITKLQKEGIQSSIQKIKETKNIF